MPEVMIDRPASFPWTFVGLTYAISWTVWIAGWLALGKPGQLTDGGAIFAVILAGSFGPGLAAAILTLRGGRDEFLTWARAFVNFRCGWRPTRHISALAIAIVGTAPHSYADKWLSGVVRHAR